MAIDFSKPGVYTADDVEAITEVNQPSDDMGLLLNQFHSCWTTKYSIWVLGPWGLMAKKMTLLLQPQKLVCYKEPSDTRSLLWVTAAVKEETMSWTKAATQAVEDQNRGLKVQVALLRAELVLLIAEVISLTVDIETQKLEDYVLQKEVQMVSESECPSCSYLPVTKWCSQILL